MKTKVKNQVLKININNINENKDMVYICKETGFNSNKNNIYKTIEMIEIDKKKTKEKVLLSKNKSSKKLTIYKMVSLNFNVENNDSNKRKKIIFKSMNFKQHNFNFKESPYNSNKKNNFKKSPDYNKNGKKIEYNSDVVNHYNNLSSIKEHINSERYNPNANILNKTKQNLKEEFVFDKVIGITFQDIVKILNIPSNDRIFDEVKLIKDYLIKFPSFTNFLSKIVDSKEDVLNSICSSLKHKYNKKNSILFRYGDKGDNYYIILNGKVNILVSKPEQLKLKKEDYLRYLYKLRALGEEEVFKNVMFSNEGLFQFSESELEMLNSEKVNHEILKKMFIDYSMSLDKRNQNTFKSKDLNKLIELERITMLDKFVKDTINEVDINTKKLQLQTNVSLINVSNDQHINTIEVNSDNKDKKFENLNHNTVNINDDSKKINSETIIQFQNQPINHIHRKNVIINNSIMTKNEKFSSIDYTSIYNKINCSTFINSEIEDTINIKPKRFSKLAFIKQNTTMNSKFVNLHYNYYKQNYLNRCNENMPEDIMIEEEENSDDNSDIKKDNKITNKNLNINDDNYEKNEINNFVENKTNTQNKDSKQGSKNIFDKLKERLKNRKLNSEKKDISNYSDFTNINYDNFRSIKINNILNRNSSVLKSKNVNNKKRQNFISQKEDKSNLNTTNEANITDLSKMSKKEKEKSLIFNPLANNITKIAFSSLMVKNKDNEINTSDKINNENEKLISSKSLNKRLEKKYEEELTRKKHNSLINIKSNSNFNENENSKYNSSKKNEGKKKQDEKGNNNSNSKSKVSSNQIAIKALNNVMKKNDKKIEKKKNKHIKPIFSKKDLIESSVISVEDYIRMTNPDQKIINESEYIDERDYKVVTIYKYTVVSSLGPGMTFGELALISEFNKRAATVICSEDTDFGILNKVSYNKCLKKADINSFKISLNTLMNNSIFSNFSREKFKKNMYNHFKFIKINKGTIFVEEGESLKDKLIFVKSGIVKVFLHCQLDKLQNIKNYLKLFDKYVFSENNDLKQVVEIIKSKHVDESQHDIISKKLFLNRKN